MDPIHAARPNRLVDYQASLLEHPEVLRDGGTTHWQFAGELADRTRAIHQQLKDRLPSRVAKRNPCIRSVSLHEP